MESQGALESHGPGSSVGAGGGGGAMRQYDGSSSESVVSFATDSVSVTQNSVVSGSVANSVLGPDGKRHVKSSVSTTGCRQRITVVCAECKRLKLKCDRRTPCGSCTKRDTIPRCIYSQAAAEKVDVQSLNIRLQAVEGKLSGIQAPLDSNANVAGPSNARNQSSSAPGTSTTRTQQRAFLAVGAHGASVAVNLEGVAGLWVDHLGLNTSTAATRSTPETVTEMDLERLGVTTLRRSGIELRPFPSVPSEGVLDFIEETVELFRVPASLVTSSETGEEAAPGDAEAEYGRDDEHAGEDAEEEDSDQVGVSPKLIHHALPPAHIRAEIYKRLEETHLMSPSVNFFVFKNRIEEMSRWAEAELIRAAENGTGSRENGRPTDEPHPTTMPTLYTTITTGAPAPPSASTTSTGTFSPTLSFFAAAALGMALGARCWLIEREVLGGDSEFKPPLSSVADRARSPGSSNAGAALGPNMCTYDQSMPPPPLPISSYDIGSSTSPASPPSGPSSSVPGPSTSHNPGHVPLPIDPALPGKLYRLAKFALNLSLERVGYEAFDADYIHAKCLQSRYLLMSYTALGEGTDLLCGLGIGRRKKVEKRKRKTKPNGQDHGDDAIMGDADEDSPSNSRRKGKKRAPSRGPALALAPEIVGVISDAIGNARMMGMNHDPELFGCGKFSVYEIEIRRRLWWELVIADAFIADCLGVNPFIDDKCATTEFPTDVDEEAFGPDSANRPAPNIESIHGNIDYFIQRCRLVALAKKLSRKVAAFKELNPNPRPGETCELLEMMKGEIADWLANLPDHLKLKDVPSIHADVKSMSPPIKRPPGTPAERDDTVVEESPHLIGMRCRLAISARYIFMSLCLSFTKGTMPDAKGNSKAKEGTGMDYLGPSAKSFEAFMMLEPAIYIVQVWRYLHSVMRNVHPALFMCYAFSKELFDAAVVLGHLAIEQPLFADRALTSLRLAAETIRDPSVLTSKASSATGENGSLPSEAVRIIEELILKAEAAALAASAVLGGGFGLAGMGTPPIMKRKHEEVETTGSDLYYQFRFPFVGAGVVSAGPPVETSAVSSPRTDAGNMTGMRSSDSNARGGSASLRSKHSAGPTTDTATAAAVGDPRPATSRLKSSHPQISVRNRNRKDSSRARANSATSQRSDVPHMLPPTNPPIRPSNSSSHAHPHAAHNVPPHRISSVEPAAPLLGSSTYSGALSTTSGSGPTHYTSPPGTSGGTSQQPQTSGSEFSSSGFDTGGFHSSSPASYGPPFTSQSGPSLPVPSQVGYDGFNIGSSGQGRGGISMGNEPSPYPFNSSNGIERPGPVGMHQSSGFDSIGGLPRPPPESAQDRPFSRNPAENRSQTRDADDQIGPPMQSLEHQQQSHAHTPLHPPQTYNTHGWTEYPSWPYYQG